MKDLPRPISSFRVTHNGLRTLLTACLMVMCLVVQAEQPAQTLDQLRAQQRQLSARITRINDELSRTKGSLISANKRLELLNAKIASRRKILTNLATQIRRLDSRLGDVNSKTFKAQTEFDHLSMAYNKTIQASFEALHRSPRSDFQSTRNAYFVRYLADSLARRATRLMDDGAKLKGMASDLSTQLNELAVLRGEHDKEIASLEREILQANELARALGKTTIELSSEASEQRAQIELLERKIEQAIAHEVKSSASDTGRDVAQMELSSSDFAINKGHLPWPIVRGATIIEQYGLNQVQKGIKINTNGITIRPSDGARDVRAIFGGQVRRVFSIMGLGQCVIVRHGIYLSVYSSLVEVSVVVGDQISASTLVGRVVDGGTLHFELWRENTSLNPVEWLAKN
ncbi:MAG: peptidoglycan DD-metalloendopeptidase family protein [Mucinivorans sp.]